MWVLLSSRLRTWLILAVAVPVIHRVLTRIAASRAVTHPDARSTTVLRRADSALARVQARRRGRRHHD